MALPLPLKHGSLQQWKFSACIYPGRSAEPAVSRYPRLGKMGRQGRPLSLHSLPRPLQLLYAGASLQFSCFCCPFQLRIVSLIATSPSVPRRIVLVPTQGAETSKMPSYSAAEHPGNATTGQSAAPAPAPRAYTAMANPGTI
jgi:hypothetical protein